jgi:hypothetical protein
MTKSRTHRASSAGQVEVGVRIPVLEATWLSSELTLPASAGTVIVFAHGSGSSRGGTGIRQKGAMT